MSRECQEADIFRFWDMMKRIAEKFCDGKIGGREKFVKGMMGEAGLELGRPDLILRQFTRFNDEGCLRAQSL